MKSARIFLRVWKPSQNQRPKNSTTTPSLFAIPSFTGFSKILKVCRPTLYNIEPDSTCIQFFVSVHEDNPLCGFKAVVLSSRMILMFALPLTKIKSLFRQMLIEIYKELRPSTKDVHKETNFYYLGNKRNPITRFMCSRIEYLMGETEKQR